MSLREKYLTILGHLAPAGAVGLSAVLGAAAPAAASEPPESAQPPVAKDGVSDRLAAVRDAVSIIDGDRTDTAKAEGRLAWGNWGWGWGRGWGWPNWNNWHDWHNWNNWWRNW